MKLIETVTKRGEAQLVEFDKLRKLGYSLDEYRSLYYPKNVPGRIEIILDHYFIFMHLGFKKEKILSIASFKEPMKILSSLMQEKKRLSTEMDPQAHEWISIAKKEAYLMLSSMASKPFTPETYSTVEELTDTINLLTKLASEDPPANDVAALEMTTFSKETLEIMMGYCNSLHQQGFSEEQCIDILLRKDGLDLLKSLDYNYAKLKSCGVNPNHVSYLTTLKHGLILLTEFIKDYDQIISSNPPSDAMMLYLAIEKHNQKKFRTALEKINNGDRTDLIECALDALNFIEFLKKNLSQNANLAHISLAPVSVQVENFDSDHVEDIQEILPAPIEDISANHISQKTVPEGAEDFAKTATCEIPPSTNSAAELSEVIARLKGYGFDDQSLQRATDCRCRGADDILHFVADNYAELKDICHLDNAAIVDLGFRRDRLHVLKALIKTYPQLNNAPYNFTDTELRSIASRECSGYVLNVLVNEYLNLKTKLSHKDIVSISQKRYSAQHLLFLSANLDVLEAVPTFHLIRDEKHSFNEMLNKIKKNIQTLVCQPSLDTITLKIPMFRHSNMDQVKTNRLTIHLNSTPEDEAIVSVARCSASFFPSFSGNKRGLDSCNKAEPSTKMQRLIDEGYLKRHLEQIAQKPQSEEIFSFMIEHQTSLESVFFEKDGVSVKDRISALAAHHPEILKDSLSPESELMLLARLAAKSG